MVDAAPGPSVHLLPAAVSPELVPVLTCLLSDILQLCSSSPAVHLVTAAKARDKTNTDCLAIVTAYMLLYTVPALGRLTNASPSRGGHSGRAFCGKAGVGLEPRGKPASVKMSC